MNKKKDQAPLLNIGASSLLVVFLVLCLLTFAVLSLISAKRDLDFSQQLAMRRTTYYNVNNQAERIAASVDGLLQQAYEADPDNYEENAAALIREADWSGVNVEVAEEAGSTCVRYEIPVDDRQALQVKLTLTDVTETDTYYEVSKWDTELSVTYNEEQKINLIQMEE